MFSFCSLRCSKIKNFFSCLNLHDTKCQRHALLALVGKKFYFLHTNCCWVVLANISQELKFSFWNSKNSEFLVASWKFSTTGGMLLVQSKLEVICCYGALICLPCNDWRIRWLKNKKINLLQGLCLMFHWIVNSWGLIRLHISQKFPKAVLLLSEVTKRKHESSKKSKQIYAIASYINSNK